jgi:hypothetical protein
MTRHILAFRMPYTHDGPATGPAVVPRTPARVLAFIPRRHVDRLAAALDYAGNLRAVGYRPHYTPAALRALAAQRGHRP